MLTPSSETIKSSDHITLPTEASWKTGDKVKSLAAQPSNGITFENNVLICSKPIVVEYDSSTQGNIYLNGGEGENVVILSALSLDRRSTLSVRNNFKVGSLVGGFVEVGKNSTLKVESASPVSGNISLSENSTLEINDTPENRKLSISTDGTDCSLVLIDDDGVKKSYSLANNRSNRRIESIVGNNEVLEEKPKITQAEVVRQYSEKQDQLFDIEGKTNTLVILRNGSSEFKFTQLKRIAAGRYGEVYLGVQLDGNNNLRFVAVKYLNESDDKEVARDFKREIETVVSLRSELKLGPDSTLVPQVLFVGKNEEGREVFAINYCSGINIQELARKNTIDLNTSLEIMQEVARTIYGLHQIGKSALDFQPGNYFFDPTKPEGKRVSSIDYNLLDNVSPENVQRDIRKMANMLHAMITGGTVDATKPGNFEYFAKYPELQKFFNDIYQSKFPDVPHFIMETMVLSTSIEEINGLPKDLNDFKMSEYEKEHKKSKVVGNAKTKEEERELFYASGRLKNKKLTLEVRDRLEQKVKNLAERIERIINTPEEPKVEALPVQEVVVPVAQVSNTPLTSSPNSTTRQRFIDRLFRRSKQ